MKRIARFHKVSEARFIEDWKDTFGETPQEVIEEIYAQIRLPEEPRREAPVMIFSLRRTWFCIQGNH